MAKVSIVIPIYNAERFLPQCIESILAQSYKDIEVIAVNDGSTDSSLSILQKYAMTDNRVKIIDKANSGYGASMNQGLSAATGKYFGIVDSDDYILPNMCSRLVELAEKNNLDFVRGGYYKFYTVNGEDRQTYWSSMGARYRNVVYCPRESTNFYMSAVLIPSGIYNISFLRANDICFNETPGAAFQDHGFWFKTHILANRVMFIEDAYYMYRFDHEESSVYNPRALELMSNEYDHIEQFVNSHHDLNPLISSFYWKARFTNCTVSFTRIMGDALNPKNLNPIKIKFQNAKDCGSLNTGLMSPSQIDELNLLLTDTEKYCDKFRMKWAHANYDNYIKVFRDGKKLSRAQQFKWYASRYGIDFAIQLTKRKVSNKRRSVQVSQNEESTNRILAQTKMQNTKIDRLSHDLKLSNERNEMMFWWSMHNTGETLTETKMRVFNEMPKAEGKLRQRQIEYSAVLSELKRVLDASDIDFWPMGGTMIGMLRHKGFIPWDDDIDISLFADDKQRLFDVIGASESLSIEEVYWVANTDALRCPRVRFSDSSKGAGLVDIFFWEHCNNESTANENVWSIRNKYHQKLFREWKSSRKNLHNKTYDGCPITDPHDLEIIEEIFNRNENECRQEIGCTGSSIYGSVDMWFDAGRWNAVYCDSDIHPFREAEFEGVKYKIPQSAELFLKMQYGDWLSIPSKVSPNHGG